MQNSVLKLISIAGVLGIGTLVVIEVHNKMPKPGAAPAVSEDENALSDAPEVSRFPETEPSEFQVAMNHPERSFAGTNSDPDEIDTDPFGDMFGGTITEPDIDELGSVDVRVDPNGLTDDASPFAPNQFAAGETPSQGESIPVRPVGFSEKQPAAAALGTEDLPDFSAEPFLPDPENGEPELSFEVSAPEPAVGGLSLPNDNNPFDLDHVAAEPEPTPTKTAVESSRETNTLQFFPEDRAATESQPANAGEEATGEIDFGSLFEGDAVPVDSEPEIESPLDAPAGEFELQPTPHFVPVDLTPPTTTPHKLPLTASPKPMQMETQTSTSPTTPSCNNVFLKT